MRSNIHFRVVPSNDRSARQIMLTLFKEPEANRAHLTHYLGVAGAEEILELMAARTVSGRYKEFNLLRGDRSPEGFDWILLMGLGSAQECARVYRLHDRVRSLVAIAARHFQRKRLMTFAVSDFGFLDIPGDVAGGLIAEGAVLGTYRFDRYKSNRKSARGEHLEAIHVLHEGAPEAVKASLEAGAQASISSCWSRDLVNTPSCDLRPLDFARQVQQLAEQTPGLRATILSKSDMERERFGLHLAVSLGSDAPPCVAILEYCPRGHAEGWDLAMVGKGVTFDSGGYDIKSSAGMRRMYRDMAGAAAVFGAMRTIAIQALDINAVGIMPLAENLINGSAFRVGDILKSRKGISVEVTNTDAEGRLLLADSLDYACEQYQPRHLVDLATLTGAVRVALGLFVTGLFTHALEESDDETLAEHFKVAGRATGEWTWRMPVDDDYRVQLASPVADIESCNIDGNSGAGSITATIFLKQFVNFDIVCSWAHLDIAATSFMERTVIYNKCPYMPKVGATGIGARLLPAVAERLIQQR